ncbi:MAG: PAS domain S-box protein [Fimbriimonas sp.]
MTERQPRQTIQALLGPAFARAKVGMCCTDQEGRVIAANPELCLMFQMTQEEIIGHNFLIFVPRPDRRTARQSFQAVVEGGFLDQPDWFVRLRDGGTMWVRVAPSLYELPDGSRTVLSVLTDVTGSRSAEAARQRAEHRARGFMESNVMGVMEWTVDGTIVDANDAFAKLVGFSRASNLPEDLEWQQLTPPEYAPIDRAAMRELLETGSCRPYAKELFRTDGSRIAVLVASTRLSEDEGRFVTYLLDRTDAKMVEAALMEGQETLRRVLDTALDAVILMDANGTVREWLGSSERLLGWSSTEVIGQSFIDLLVAPNARERIRNGMDRYLLEEAYDVIGAKTEIEALHKDGHEVPVELSMSAATLGGRTILCAFLHDVTQRRKAEEQAKDMNRILETRVEERTAELQRAFEELERFSYSVSHDLRAPLRSINGFATVVMSEYKDELGSDGMENLQRILAASKRMAQLIDELLGFARLARVQLRMQDIDMSVLAVVVTKDLETHWPQHTEFKIQPGMKAKGDLNLIRLVLTNLVSNALKFTSRVEHPLIEIGEDPERGFFVKDNGAGFNPDFASRLFRPFERLHTDEDFQGTGIGLANVERVIRRHGGEVSAEGSPGKGATFYFTLGEN